MSVHIAGQLIQQPSGLSELGRLALAFVDGGLEWLRWALATPAARYEFADETALLSAVQQGLHAQPCTLLPHLGLEVSPVKLMTLGLGDLRTLAQAEGRDDEAAPDETLAAQLRRVLNQHGLLLPADLRAGMAWLTPLGVAEAPVFQAPGLMAQVRLAELAVQAPLSERAAEPAFQQEAARFAVQQARTPHEFCDYFQLHQCLAARNPAEALTPAACTQQAGEAMQALLPLLFGSLDCPQVGELPSPGQVLSTVKQWLASGKRIGFSRLSEGLVQVVEYSVEHNAWKSAAGDANRRVIEMFHQAAQALLVSATARRGRMGQDGASCLFTLDSGAQQAQLQLSPQGVISLRRFGPTPTDPSTETSP